ncbi:MAG TPA: chromate transporter, partial [Bacillota bacterium]|nr:chromate transporter [Bacillota bacterium]
MTLPELLVLFLAFFEIGLFTFGGGYAMIPMIEEAVLRHGWLANTSFSLVDFIAVSESTPGPFAVNIATFIGMTEAGIPGAILATVGVVLPSFIVILLIARFFRAF